MSPFSIRLTFHGDLPFFLGSKASTVERQLSEKTSVKDVIEACGVPHTEVDLIIVNGVPVDFACVVDRESSIEVYPVGTRGITSFAENRLQLVEITSFVADGHLGKLVRDLRLLGVDVVYDPAAEDRQLVTIASSENRALLTRDRRLLMHAIVRHGYYLRSQEPMEQTLEILHRFDLGSALAPFTRCLRCNTVLKPAKKAEVFDQLEPLTKIYYEQFRRCSGCGQVYWSGSHFAKLQNREIAGDVVSVFKDGQVLFEKGYGYADFAAKKPVLADQTLFRPGSISKLFTATAVMQLVEQGKLDLDRDVNEYLDFAIPKTYPEPVTLRRLLTHTAGFEDTLK